MTTIPSPSPSPSPSLSFSSASTSISILPSPSSSDTLTHIQFNSLNQLSSVSLDGTLRIFSIDILPSSSPSSSPSPPLSTPFLSLQYDTPLLSSVWNPNDMTKIYLGGVEGTMIEVDTIEQNCVNHETNRERSAQDPTSLSLHGIHSLEYHNEYNLLLLAKYNGDILFYDTRINVNSSILYSHTYNIFQNYKNNTTNTPTILSTMRLLQGSPRIYCSTNTRDLLIYDIRKFEQKKSQSGNSTSSTSSSTSSTTSPLFTPSVYSLPSPIIRDTGLLEQINIIRPFHYHGIHPSNPSLHEESYAVGSYQSRVAIDFLGDEKGTANKSLEKEKFAWKSHKSVSGDEEDNDKVTGKPSGLQRLYSVTEMVPFSPFSSFSLSLPSLSSSSSSSSLLSSSSSSSPSSLSSTLMLTGGTDGCVNVWDLKGRKRIHQYERGMGKHEGDSTGDKCHSHCNDNVNGIMNNVKGGKGPIKDNEKDKEKDKYYRIGGVTSMDINEAGDLLAVAYGYNWEWGNNNPTDENDNDDEDEEENGGKGKENIYKSNQNNNDHNNGVIDGMSKSERRGRMRCGTKLVVKAIQPHEVLNKGKGNANGGKK